MKSKFCMIAGFVFLCLFITSPVFAAHFEFNFENEAGDGPIVLKVENAGRAIFSDWDLGLAENQRLDSITRVHLNYTIEGTDNRTFTIMSLTGESGGQSWIENGNVSFEYGYALGQSVDEFLYADAADGILRFSILPTIIQPEEDGWTLILKSLYFEAEVSEVPSGTTPVPGSGLLFGSAILLLAATRRK